jgi:hypothetical protein
MFGAGGQEPARGLSALAVLRPGDGGGMVVAMETAYLKSFIDPEWLELKGQFEAILIASK